MQEAFQRFHLWRGGKIRELWSGEEAKFGWRSSRETLGEEEGNEYNGDRQVSVLRLS
jgi:hypothetical protein